MSPAVASASTSCVVGQTACAAASPVSTAGRTPAPPAVGAATMTPIAALTSCTASARASTSRNGVPASGPGGPCDELGRVAADEPRRGLEIAREAPLDRALHDVQRAPQHVADLGDGTTLIVGLGVERELRQRDPRGFGVTNRGGERAVHVREYLTATPRLCRAETPSAPTAARECGRAPSRPGSRRAR